VNSESALSRRHVWALMFNQLPSDPACSGNQIPKTPGESGDAAQSTSEYSPFDDLDQCSAFFEQYVIQDVRESATIQEVLGGAERVDSVQTQLRESGSAIVHLCLIVADETPAGLSPDPTHSGASQKSELFGQDRNVSFAELRIPRTGHPGEPVPLHDAVRDAIVAADLIWVETHIQTESADSGLNAAEVAVRWVQQMRSMAKSHERPNDVLLVSSLRGPGRQINSPFTSIGDEGLVHAPLWIDYGSSHSCRIQSLVGSFDFLPTILEYVTGITPAEQHSQPDVESTTSDHASQTGSRVLTNLDGAPISLVTAAESFCPGRDRLLRLTGDSWTALRSQQYLLVQTTQCDHPQTADSETGAEPGEVPIRYLYLKPDDVWNVQNMIVAYEAIADEMETLAETLSADAPSPESV